MIRSIPSSFKFFSAPCLVITACILSIVFAVVQGKTMVAYLSGALLLVSLMLYFIDPLERACDQIGAKALKVIPIIKRVAIKAAAALVALAAFALSMFATSFAGVIEPFITTTAAVLSIVAGMAAGFMAGYQLEAPTQHQHAGKRG